MILCNEIEKELFVCLHKSWSKFFDHLFFLDLCKSYSAIGHRVQLGCNERLCGFQMIRFK